MDRPELGVLLSRLLRDVLAREETVLRPEGLGMWEYVVLAALGDGDAPTQSDLAAATGRDKTRLIGNLDRLEERGLVVRTPDPADRRNRIVALTGDGRRMLTRCRAGIREQEEALLAALPQSQREAFERALVRLVP